MSDERSLAATTRKRQQARKEGRVAATPYLGGAIVWTLFFALLCSASPWVLNRCDELLESNFHAISNASYREGIRPDLLHVVRGCYIDVGSWLLPCLLCVLAVAILSRVAQVGFVWAPSRVGPSFSRVAPMQRFGHVFSLDTLFQFLRGIILFGLACLLVGYGIWSQRHAIAESVDQF